MGRGKRSLRAARVEAVRSGIEHWRSVRAKHARMPEELWKAAASLAEVDGAYAIARELGLDYAALKRRVERAATLRRESISRGFVELDGAQLIGATQAAGSVVELGGPDGAQLTVRLRGGEALDVVALAEAFFRRGA